ncbi:MAG: hypothetical protein ACREFQ_17540 [Stellaceae bacterium]
MTAVAEGLAPSAAAPLSVARRQREAAADLAAALTRLVTAERYCSASACGPVLPVSPDRPQ